LVEKAHPWAFSTRKAENVALKYYKGALQHFSNTNGVFEKWRHILVPHAGGFSTAC
jgi:hypothetical protein